MKILAIDDERLALAVLVKSIQTAVPDAEVFPFHSSLEALEAAKQTKFDIAFSDIQMPNLRGIELAKSLKRTNPYINIIFVTGYDNYKGDAIHLHASDYLEKPVTRNDIEYAMKNLLYPLDLSLPTVYIQAFGNFELFVNQIPVEFKRSKSKELLAYLVDRRGATITRKEIAAVLFESGTYSRTEQQYLSHIANDLQKDLEQVGADQIFIKRFSSYAVDTRAFSCDAYDYLSGNATAINLFRGEYMEQYSWAEYAKEQFYSTAPSTGDPPRAIF